MESKPFKCDLCVDVKKFKHKKHLLEHQRHVHKLKIPHAKETTIKCSFCVNRFLTYDNLRQHLIETHGMNLYQETAKFKTVEDFQSWKSEKEKEYECVYTLYSVYKSVKEARKITYYSCHRSGRTRAKEAEARKRNVKRQGSCKMGSSCPSTIKLVELESTGLIEGKIWFPHSHEKSLRFMNLSKDELQITGNVHAVLISQKISLDETEVIHTVDITAPPQFDRTLLQSRDIQCEENMSGRIMKKMKLFYNQLASGKEDKETLVKFEKALDVAIQHYNMGSTNISFSQAKECKEPENKRIAPQIRFESTKKKRTSKKPVTTLPKAEFNEKTYFKIILDMKTFHQLHSLFRESTVT